MNIPEEQIAFISRPEDGNTMFLRNVGISAREIHSATTEKPTMIHIAHENLKFYVVFYNL
jgi:hypothetical protein